MNWGPGRHIDQEARKALCVELQAMEMIRDGGKTVVCPECYAHLHLPEPVKEGQEIPCHQCRVLVVIKEVDGKLTPTVRTDQEAEEDTTW